MKAAPRYKRRSNTQGVPDDEWAKLTQQEKQSIRHRNWRRKNRARVRESYRQWAEANPDKLKESRAAYREANRERLNAIHREYKRRNAERMAEYQREYRARNATARRLMCNPEEVFAAILKLLPPALPRHIKDDVAGEVCLMVLEREVPAAKMADAVKEALRRQNRMFDYFKTISIDTPIAGFDGLTIGDTLAAKDEARE